jgi:hypothetical protein
VKSATGPDIPDNAFAQWPTPTTSNIEPLAESVPPVQMPPLVKIPVLKLTVPRECPAEATLLFQLRSSDPRVEIPLLEMETVPNWLVRLTASAQAAIGNSRAHRPTTTAIRLIVSSTEFG